MIFMIHVFDDGMVAVAEVPRENRYIEALEANGFTRCDGPTWEAAREYMIIFDSEDERPAFNDWLKDEQS